MEKLLKRVVSVICAMAMVVTGLVFTPSKVDAKTALVSGVATNVGAWELKSTNEKDLGYSQMSYDSTGNELGQTTMYLDSSPNGDWNDVEYGMYARLKNYNSNKMKADMPYKLAVDINTTKAGTLIASVEGKEFRIKVNAGSSTVKSDEFDHDEFATVNTQWDPTLKVEDVTFFLGMFPKDTQITISKVDFEAQATEWTPVPNFNPDSGGTATHTHAGKVDLLAMYGVKSELYGKMKFKVANEGQSIADTTIKVTKNSGWLDAWSVSARLSNYCSTVEVKKGSETVTGLSNGDYYDGTFVINSNKPTTEDEHGKQKNIRIVLSGKAYDYPLAVGDNEIKIEDFKYTGKADIDFELDCVDPDTELVIKSVSFVANDPDWTRVENEATVDVGAWQLFARTGTTVEEGQWGALSYKNAEGVETPVNPEDTLIKVRSSSGWHNAWATLAMLPNFLSPEGSHKLEVGRTYRPVIKYYSSKATEMDDSGDQKTVLFSVDNTNLAFPLEACKDESDIKTVKLDPFTYEEQKPEKPYDCVFNLDQVEPKTVLRFVSIDFEVVDDGWEPIPNKKYTPVGTTGMELYARMGDTVEEGSWGKISYKFDDKTVTDDFSKVLVKTRTTSGWYVTHNPASRIDFPGLADKEMTEANKYKVRVTLEANRSDEIKSLDGSSEEIHNNIKFIVDSDKEYEFKSLPDNQEVAYETDYFVYQKNSDDFTIVLDEFTKNATIRVKKIEFIRDPSEPNWIPVENAKATKVGAWTLYANFNAESESYGKIFYANSTETPSALGDTTMNCYSTSGWFGARSIIATLNGYTKGKLTVGENYSTSITIDSSEDCFGMGDDGTANGIKVTIDDTEYIIPIYKGKYTYVIPKLNKVYSNTNTNVQFFLDKLKPTTKINISSVDFGSVINDPVEISALATEAQADGTVKVTWEQTKDTIYGTAGNEGKFKIFVDGTEAAVVDGNVREYTTSALAEGTHEIKVVATLGAKESAGATSTVVVSKDTTVAPTTEAPTTAAPTVKPTVAPTSKAAVTKPGKAKVKKIAKRKKSAKKITVTLKKVSGATKYQVAVYKSKKNAKKNKKAIVKKIVKKLKATIKSKKLKGKKTLFVRARAWNTAGYGAWSGIKKSKAK